jgi:hypothetical protein
LSIHFGLGSIGNPRVLVIQQVLLKANHLYWSHFHRNPIFYGDQKRAQKKWGPKNPHYHTNYSREWKRNLPIERKEYYRLQKNEYVKGYYERNKQHILEYHKVYNRKNQNQKGLKERTRTNN